MKNHSTTSTNVHSNTFSLFLVNIPLQVCLQKMKKITTKLNIASFSGIHCAPLAGYYPSFVSILYHRLLASFFPFACFASNFYAFFPMYIRLLHTLYIFCCEIYVRHCFYGMHPFDSLLDLLTGWLADCRLRENSVAKEWRHGG